MEDLMRKILLFIKQNALLIILFFAVVVTVIIHAPSKPDEIDCDSDHVICDPPFDGWNEYGKNKMIGTSTEAELIDTSKYASVIPVSIGTKWAYEGNLLFYDREAKENREVVARKVVEVTDIEEVEGGVKIYTKETYTNDPDFTERTKSYLVSESGFDFGTGKLTDLPLTLNQVLQESDIERDDNLYSTYVSRVHSEKVLGKEYQCYDISSNTLGDTSFQTFCEGIGYVRDYYEHHGTPNESDYRLVSIGVSD